MKTLDKYINNYLTTYKPYKGELKWNYEDGCVLLGSLRMYEATKEKRYYDVVYDYMSRRIDETGTIINFSYLDYNIDNVNAGKVLFSLYEESGEERFKMAIDKVYYQLIIQPRTKQGNFWHKARYPYQVWLDGLYMAQPFYAQYETLFNGKQNYADIYNQFSNVRKLMYDNESGLYYHGYDETKTMSWADKKTGHSQNFWGRAVGWYSMALIDVLDTMSDQIFEYHRELQKLFKELITSVVKYQDQNSGMWSQVLSREGQEGNYFETSSTLMFAYSILKGVRLGYLNEEFFQNGKKALEGIVKNVMVEKDDSLSLENICIMAGLNGLVPFGGDRSGTYEYYLSEPVGADDPKGTGPLMMAYSEFMKASVQ